MQGGYEEIDASIGKQTGWRWLVVLIFPIDSCVEGVTGLDRSIAFGFRFSVFNSLARRASHFSDFFFFPIDK